MIFILESQLDGLINSLEKLSNMEEYRRLRHVEIKVGYEHTPILNKKEAH